MLGIDRDFRGVAMLENQPSMIGASGSGKTGVRPWVLRAVLFVAAVALIAETAPPTYNYPFAMTVAGPTTALTSDAPDARYRVNVRATGVAPNGRPTTDTASGMVDGTIAITGVDDAPFVAISVSHDGVTPDAELSALTSFGLPVNLVFDGSCKKPSEAEPCTSSFFVDFARDDGGDRGGSVDVSWTLVFRSSVEKDNEPDGRERELPWTVEIVRE
jgi:hypothetical protein